MGGREPPSFRFEVLGSVPSGDRHLLRFRVRNGGDAPVEKLAVEGRLAAEPAETAALTLDYLAAGEKREAALVSPPVPPGILWRWPPRASSCPEPE